MRVPCGYLLQKSAIFRELTNRRRSAESAIGVGGRLPAAQSPNTICTAAAELCHSAHDHQGTHQAGLAYKDGALAFPLLVVNARLGGDTFWWQFSAITPPTR